MPPRPGSRSAVQFAVQPEYWLFSISQKLLQSQSGSLFGSYKATTNRTIPSVSNALATAVFSVNIRVYWNLYGVQKIEHLAVSRRGRGYFFEIYNSQRGKWGLKVLGPVGHRSTCSKIRFRSGWLGASHRSRSAMTGRAIFWSRLVEKHGLGADRFCQLVAISALHVLVSAAQWENSSLLVVEERRSPFHAVVAVSTRGGFTLGELLSMDVFVAVLAQKRGRFEIDIDELGFEVRRLMAVDASSRTMRSEQREFRL
jgi:hypothetical protein